MPTRADLALRVPAEATHLIDSTHRILRLYAMSGARNPKALRRWKDSQSDADLKSAGFSTSTAQQIAKELFPEEQEAESVTRDPDPDASSANSQEEGGDADDDEADARGVTRVDASALSLFQQWQKQIKEERAEAASEARAQEREIAKVALDAEKKTAQACMDAEKREAQSMAKLQRAHMRLFATIATFVALAGGVAIGIAWTRHTMGEEAKTKPGVSQNPQLQQPAVHAGVKPPQVEEKEARGDTQKPDPAASGSSGDANTDKPTTGHQKQEEPAPAANP